MASISFVAILALKAITIALPPTIRISPFNSRFSNSCDNNFRGEKRRQAPRAPIHFFVESILSNKSSTVKNPFLIFLNNHIAP